MTAARVPSVRPGDGCPVCQRPLDPPVIDLGEIPGATNFPWPDDPSTVDPKWPLVVHLCGSCGLVHLGPAAPDEDDPPELTGLAVLSSTLSEHARARAAGLAAALGLRPEARVVERSSHGNHSPAAWTAVGLDVVTMAHGSAASALRERGLAVVEDVAELPLASVDLVVDDYALAHDRDPVAVLAALAGRLAPGGVMALEFDDLGSIVSDIEYDAFRHGHHLYLSAASLTDIAHRAGLRLLSVMAVDAHGGAGRAILGRDQDAGPVDPSAGAAVRRDISAGLTERSTYEELGRRIGDLRADLSDHLATARSAGRRVAGYGAPSRAVTLANHVAITSDLVAYTADLSPAKHGRSLPGVRLPIVPVDRLESDPPDEILLFAWPLVDEIRSQLSWLAGSGTRLLRPLPRVELLEPRA